MSHQRIPSATSFTTPTSPASTVPFSPFSSAASFASEETGTSEEPGDLGEFATVFRALSQLQIQHHVQTNSSSATLNVLNHHQPSSRIPPSISSMSSLSSASDFSPLSLPVPVAYQDTEQSEFTHTSASPQSTFASASEEDDGQSISHYYGNETEADHDHDHGQTVWTHDTVSSYFSPSPPAPPLPALPALIPPSTTSTTININANESANLEEETPTLGDLESALSFLARERARIASKLDSAPPVPSDWGDRRGRSRSGASGSSRRSGAPNSRTKKNQSAAKINNDPPAIPEFLSSPSSDSDSEDDSSPPPVLPPGMLNKPKVVSLAEGGSRARARIRPKGTTKAEKGPAIPPSNSHPLPIFLSRDPPSSFPSTSSFPPSSAALEIQSPKLKLDLLQSRLHSLAQRLSSHFPYEKRMLQKLSRDPKRIAKIAGAVAEDDVVDGYRYGAEREDGKGLLHVFIDHSNILVGFLEWYKRQNTPDATSSGTGTASKSNKRASSNMNLKPKPKLSHASLILLLERSRACAKRILVASSPLYQSLDDVVQLGYEVSVLQRVEIKEGVGGAMREPATKRVQGRGNGNGKMPSTGSSTESDSGKKFRNDLFAETGIHVQTLRQHRRHPSEPSSSYSPPVATASRPAFLGHRKQASSASDRPFLAHMSASGSTGSIASNVSTSPHSSNAPATSNSNTRTRYREEAVDELLQLKVLQSLLDAPSPPPLGSTIVLATGDGASSQFNKDGFVGCVRRAVERGWEVELVGWEDGRSRVWRELEGLGGAEGGLRIFGLEQWGWDLVE